MPAITAWCNNSYISARPWCTLTSRNDSAYTAPLQVTPILVQLLSHLVRRSYHDTRFKTSGKGCNQPTVIVVKEVLCSRQERFDRCKPLALRHFTPTMAPEHVARIQPRTIPWQLQEDEPSSRRADNGCAFVILLHPGMIPGAKHRLPRRFGKQPVYECQGRR
jgi:hypothetical protein